MATGQVPLVARQIEKVSGIRPVTSLIATGIALITAILLVTGIATNHLRTQALNAADSELARIGSVLAVATNSSLNLADARLADIADDLPATSTSDVASFRGAAGTAETGALLRAKLPRFSEISGAALVGLDGEILAHAGAWPDGIDLHQSLKKVPPNKVGGVGASVRDPRSGGLRLPLIHRINGAAGEPVGAIVGIISPSYLISLFAAAPLPIDAIITLREPDGSILAHYPEQAPDLGIDLVDSAEIAPVFQDTSAWLIRHQAATEGDWQIEAWRALPDYPAAISVGRSADQVLAEWAYQGLWLVGFALVFAIAIGIVVYLIARQFRSHEDLATMREERIEAEKLESERARLAAEAELLKSERLSVLGQLTATVAHELRNPLSAIRNTLFTVKELAANGGVKLDRPVSRMERSIERCDRIISDLLEYTRHRELSRAGVRFDRWLGEMLAEQSINPATELVTRFGAADAVVGMDPDRVRRVVINLVENAAQALVEDSSDREKRITVSTSSLDGKLQLLVEDTGPGIAPENLERIFEPLFSTKSFGTGLGLPTVKQIVNQHGGTITVDSTLGQGTRVTVYLPVEAGASEKMKVAA